jgi:hypothetical protein
VGTGGGPGGVERRHEPRFDPEEFAEPIFLVGSRLVNVSPGGLMMEAPVPLALESRVHLHLVVGGERAEIEARVAGCVSRRRGRRRGWGVGVQFCSIPDAARAKLGRAVEGRRRRPRT